MNFVGVEADKERNVVVRTMEDGQKMCILRERATGGWGLLTYGRERDLKLNPYR